MAAEAPAPRPAAPPWRRAARLAALVLAGLVLLAALLLAALDTQPGKRLVAERIGRLRPASGLRITVARIDGSIYGAMTLRGVALADAQGVFLRAPAIRVDWRPLAYLGNHLDLRSVTAARLTLLRLPRLKPSAPAQPLLPDLDIDIGRLAVDRLVAEPAVYGMRRVLTLRGRAHIADRRAQIALRAGAAAGDRIDLVLDAVPAANRLALRFALDAPARGIVTGLAGLDAPLAVRLAGRGDWRRWDGTLAADLGGAPLARLALAARGGAFGLAGRVQAHRLVGGSAAGLLAPAVAVRLGSSWDQRRARVAGTAGNAAFTLAIGGGIDLARSRFAGLALDFALRQPQALGPALAARGLRAGLTLDGPMRTPTAAYTLSAAALSAGDVTLQRLAAVGRARIAPGQTAIPVSARAATISGLDSIAGGRVANVRIDGDLALAWPRLLSDNLRLRADRIDARAIVLADLRRGFYTGAFDGRVADYRVASVGTFALAARARLARTAGGAPGLTGHVAARSVRITNAGLRGLLGGQTAVAGDFAYGADGVVRFSRLRLAAPLLRVADGAGSYVPGGRIRLSARGTSQRYGPLAVELAGTLAAPRAVITAARPGLGIGLAGLSAEVRGAGGGYRVTAAGTSAYGPLAADLLLRPGRALVVEVTRATLAGVQLAGRLEQTAAGPFAGELAATGPGLAGTVRLAPAGRLQRLAINAEANGTVLPPPAGIAIGHGTIAADVLLADRIGITADAQLAQTRIGTTVLSRLRAVVRYQDGHGTVRALAEGRRGVPFRLALNARLAPQMWQAALQGTASGVALRTAAPLQIVPRADGYDLLPARIALERGSLTLAGRWTARETRLQTGLDQVDLALVDAFVPGAGIGGKVSGTADFAQAGPGAFPHAAAALAVRGFTRTTAVSVSRPMDVNLVAGVDRNQGSLAAALRIGAVVVGRVQARIVPAAMGSWAQRIGSGALAGGIRYAGPAETLFALAAQPDQRLAGPLGVAADFSCRVDSPCLTGVVRGKGLSYDNVTYGTHLTDMDLAGRFTGERLEIERLTARAGEGSVTGAGHVSLAAASGYPAAITLTLANARLADSDALRASASGSLALTKPAGQLPVLSGTVRLPETRYRLVREGSAKVPELTGVRFKPAPGVALPAAAAAAPPGAALADLGLDLAITAPAQLYISGMGLESEWSADLAVRGTITAPRVTGTAELVRGTLDFAGRGFTLREGRVRFTGGAPGDATLALTAEETIEDVDVTLAVEGPALNPRVTFSSSPGLPQDEILARILFGSSVGNLGPLQALQLAASLNSLRGSAGGLSPLGKLRAATGFDRLRLLAADATTGRGTALAVGKYIGNNIYLEVVTDARGFTATQLELALSRSLSILSQAGGANVTNTAIRYRKSY